MFKTTERQEPKSIFGGSWSDSGEEDDEKVNNETCLVAQASSEVCSESSYFSDENSSIDGLVLDNEYDKLCKMSLKIMLGINLQLLVQELSTDQHITTSTNWLVRPEENDSKKNFDDSLVKEQVSKDSSSFVESSLNVDKETIFPVDKKVEFVKPKNHEKPVKKSV
ncbi:hypothetical protein Tco_1048189, partial [Tanacetum coccineum]